MSALNVSTSARSFSPLSTVAQGRELLLHGEHAAFQRFTIRRSPSSRPQRESSLSGAQSHRLIYATDPLRPASLADLLTDQAVADTASRYAELRPPLDPASAAALGTSSGDGPSDPDDSPGKPDPKGWRRGERRADPDALLRDALRSAPEDGVPVADLVYVTGMSRSWVYYRLADLGAAGLAVQTTRGCWRAAPGSW